MMIREHETNERAIRLLRSMDERLRTMTQQERDRRGPLPGEVG